MVTASLGPFLVYLFALCLMVLGGFWGLVQSEHPAFLAPILMGLFFFYIAWKIVAEDDSTVIGPPSKQR